jgi:hypothetical protein
MCGQYNPAGKNQPAASRSAGLQACITAAGQP